LKPKHPHVESYFHEALRLANGEIDPAFLIAKHHNPNDILHREPTCVVQDAPTAHAELIEGRWAVRCPFDGCNSAQHASATDHRFFCANCRNVLIDHEYVELVWPQPASVEKIEAIVGYRLPTNRNWQHGETLKKLRDENKDHGLPTG
jgi:hypothetical protein